MMGRRKWPRFLLAGLILLGIASLIAAFISRRTIEGAIPGKAAILSLGVIDDGFLVGTATGLWRSTDGSNWTSVKKFAGSRALVASDADRAVVHFKSILHKSADLKEWEPAFGAVQAAVAIALDVEGNIYFAESADRFGLVTADGSLQAVKAQKGPREVIAVEGISGDPVVVFSGGLTSGFWRSVGGGLRWRHILKTPTRTILVDPNVSDRIFIGTAGGVLYSKDEGFKWTFTDMRLPVEALSEHDGRYFAITEDRLLYFSSDGLKDWRRVNP